VEELFVNGQQYDRKDLSTLVQHEYGKLMLQAFALNNDAVTDVDNNIKGDSTEIALLEVAIEQNIETGN